MEKILNNCVGRKVLPFAEKFERKVNPRRLNAVEASLKNSVFRELPDRDIRRLCRIARVGSLKRCEALLRAGEENATLYLITDGACLARSGRSAFGLIEAGYFAGEMSFFTGAPTSADVVARGEMQYLAWDRDRVDSLLARHPGLKSRFYALLGVHMANRLRSVAEKLAAA